MKRILREQGIRPFGMIWTALLLAAVLLFSSCSYLTDFMSGVQESGEPSGTVAKDCKHSFVYVEDEQEFSCTEGGVRISVCEKCGARKQSMLTPKGHTPVSMDRPAGCTVPGWSGGKKCSECNQILEAGVELEPTGHEYAGDVCVFCGIPDGYAEGTEYLSLYNSSYGYEYLGSMQKGEALQELYREIDKRVVAYHTDPGAQSDGEVLCRLDYSWYGLTQGEALAVWKTYRDDQPLYYWIANSVQYNSEELHIIIDPSYADGERRMEQNREIYAAIAQCRVDMKAAELESGFAYSSYNKAVYFHNAVIDAADYAYDSSGHPELSAWAHSVVGVFNGDGAVCEGFAKAYQLLLNYNGVESIYVTGVGENEAHAWNLVKLDGAWYGVDVTWDDNSEEQAPYRFFLLSEREFSKNHRENLPTDEGLDFLYALPALAEYNYEPVELYKGSARVGAYTSPNGALKAMNDANGSYTLKLKDAADPVAEHTPDAFHLYGVATLPTARSLTIEGVHTVTGNRYVATSLKIDTDLTVTYSLTIKSLFLEANTGTVTLWKVGTTHIAYGSNQTYYSDILSSVTVRRK